MGTVAVIGSGPAALMAADKASAAGHQVHIFEKRKGPARKLFIAGSSGLNITSSLPMPEFARHYTGSPSFWQRILEAFPPSAWIAKIESMGLKTFEGTSGRYFVETMHAAGLVRAWRHRLTEQGATWHFGYECDGFKSDGKVGPWQLSFRDRPDENFGVFDTVCFSLGGGSYEPDETPLRWPSIFTSKGFIFKPFEPSNVGFNVEWDDAFLKEADGLPLKNVCLKTSRGERLGDCIITCYGMEGTPVYFVGTPGQVLLDLKPDLSAEQLVAKLRQVRENLSPIRRVKKILNLCPASVALLFHHLKKVEAANQKMTLEDVALLVKSFPIKFLHPQPLAESISSSGGLCLDEIDANMMLRKSPGVFAAGEMLDWDAPTGGFLIQGSVSQGFVAGQSIVSYLGGVKV